MNILLITADDLSYDFCNCYSCQIPNLTPNIDNLSRNGYRFDDAHANIGLCQPSRAVLLTGLYPWKNGAKGFNPIFDNITTLPEILHNNGYATGIIGKTAHHQPIEKFQHDYIGKTHFAEPEIYYDKCKEFITQNKTFSLIVNISHPHRPFPHEPFCSEAEIEVPGFLPDHPFVREELTHYYQGIHKCDKIVGKVIQCLQDTGNFNNTLIIFTSDHGMPFPFMKANCYRFSTHIPLIFRHPKIKPTVDNTLVAHVDFMPTILDFLDIEKPALDGQSYCPLFSSRQIDARHNLLTCLI